MSKPADVAEAYRRSTPPGGGTSLDQISGATPIAGSASLDEQFRDRGANNPFNVSLTEADRLMKETIRRGGL
jgi:hypothetical protein